MEVNQYLGMFIEESKEHLQAINENLLNLESDPSNLSVVNEIFRSAHTLKGMAATMGFEDMAVLTHEMENALDLIRSGKLVVQSNIMDVIFQCVDILESIVFSIIEGGDGHYNVEIIVAELKQIISGEPKRANKEIVSEVLLKTEGAKIELDEFQQTVIEQSKERGHSVYLIQTTVREDCVLKAARAYIVFDHLETCGEIIKSSPTVEKLEQEKFERTFEVVLITQKPHEELENLVLNVSEIESVQIIPVVIKQEEKIEQHKIKSEEINPASTNTEKHLGDKTPPMKKVSG